jgi:hypothetical protein
MLFSELYLLLRIQHAAAEIQFQCYTLLEGLKSMRRDKLEETFQLP